MTSRVTIPVVDLFAGPGGLGEGFCALALPNGVRPFTIPLSIEKDEFAHATLRLRAFFRQFEPGRAPRNYYRFLRGGIGIDELYAKHPMEAAAAAREACRAELGAEPRFKVRARVDQAVRGSQHWVLVGGPPCQAYSVIGRARSGAIRGYRPERDVRQRLYVEYLRILADHAPAAFVMENVTGLLSASLNAKRIFERICEDLAAPARSIRREGGRVRGAGRSATYRLYALDSAGEFPTRPEDYVVWAEQHGIPQARHRVIVVGVREDLPLRDPPRLGVMPQVPLDDVIGALPRLRSGITEADDDGRSWHDAVLRARGAKWLRELSGTQRNTRAEILAALKNLTIPRRGRGAEFVPGPVQLPYEPGWFTDPRIGGVCNHLAKSHMVTDLHRYLFASCFARVEGRSPSLSDFPRSLLPNHRNVHKALGHANFSDRFRVQTYGRPATTITAHISKDGHYYIHPDPSQCRTLTVREAARLQTFPDNYLFLGPRTQQYIQVGNAVPPLLARQIAAEVHRLIT